MQLPGFFTMRPIQKVKIKAPEINITPQTKPIQARNIPRDTYGCIFAPHISQSGRF